jgi:hypothetical protein
MCDVCRVERYVEEVWECGGGVERCVGEVWRVKWGWELGYFALGSIDSGWAGIAFDNIASNAVLFILH